MENDPKDTARLDWLDTLDVSYTTIERLWRSQADKYSHPSWREVIDDAMKANAR